MKQAKELIQEYLGMSFSEAMQTYGGKDGYQQLLKDLAECNTEEFALTAERTTEIADAIIKAIDETLMADAAAEKREMFR